MPPPSSLPAIYPSLPCASLSFSLLFSFSFLLSSSLEAKAIHTDTVSDDRLSKRCSFYGYLSQTTFPRRILRNCPETSIQFRLIAPTRRRLSTLNFTIYRRFSQRGREIESRESRNHGRELWFCIFSRFSSWLLLINSLGHVRTRRVSHFFQRLNLHGVNLTRFAMTIFESWDFFVSFFVF